MQFLNLLVVLKVTVLFEERFHRVKFLRLYVVKKSPQLLGVVLYWSASQKENSFARVVFEQLESLSLLVLQSVCLVHHNVDERDFLEDWVQILHENLEGGNYEVEFE